MGKRKKSSRGPKGPKKREPLATTFSCLFCNHENSVTVKLDKKLGLGNLSCKVCGQRFQTGINYLSAPVDVYSDWVDACDTVAKSTANQDEDDEPKTGPSQASAIAIQPAGVESYAHQADDDNYWKIYHRRWICFIANMPLCRRAIAYRNLCSTCSNPFISLDFWKLTCSDMNFHVFQIRVSEETLDITVHRV